METASSKPEPQMRYLYYGLMGAGFSRPRKQRQAVVSESLSDRLDWPLNAPEPQEEPPAPARHSFHFPDVGSIEKQVARLTAERDSARSERELEADYREALGRTVEMLRKQLEEAQRRIAELEAVGTSREPSAREEELEEQLVLARRRIEELEGAGKRVDLPPALQVAPQKGQDEMMDVFLQFVGSQQRPDDAEV